MGLFSKIKDAKYSEGGVYLKKGVYKLEIQACKIIHTRQNKDGFVAEVKILESNNVDLPKGSLASWMVMMDKEPALGNIKQFISATMGCEIDEVDEAAAELVVSKENPLGGHIVWASANDIVTKQGRPFTKVKFFNESEGDAASKDFSDNQ